MEQADSHSIHIHLAQGLGGGCDAVLIQGKVNDAAGQDVPSTLFGLVPKAWIWPGMWCAARPTSSRTAT